MAWDKLINRLTDEEGDRRKMYLDSKGIPTIGVGRNLRDKGISAAEEAYLLANDLADTEHELDKHIPWWRNLSSIRQEVLMDMCFNMGWGDGSIGLSSFRNTLFAVEHGDYSFAAKGIINSQYHREVGARAEHMSFAMEHDYFPLV